MSNHLEVWLVANQDDWNSGVPQHVNYLSLATDDNKIKKTDINSENRKVWVQTWEIFNSCQFLKAKTALKLKKRKNWEHMFLMEDNLDRNIQFLNEKRSIHNCSVSFY